MVNPYEQTGSAQSEPIDTATAQGWVADNMHKPFGFGQDIRRPDLLGCIPKDQLIQGIITGAIGRNRFKERIEAYRKDLHQKKHKLGLPWFSGAVFNGTRAKQNIQFCHYMVIDVDDLHASIAELGNIKLRIVRELQNPPFLVFLSPGLGLKLVYELERSVGEREFDAVWEKVAKELEDTLGIKADAGAKSIAQVCFFSYDPSAIVITDAMPLEIPTIPAVEQKCVARRFMLTEKRLTNPLGELQRNIALAEEIVNYMLRVPKIEYQHWIKMAMALKNSLGDQGLPLFLKFACHPGYNDTPEYLSRIWKGLRSMPKPGFGSLIWVAQNYGWIEPAENKLNGGIHYEYNEKHSFC